MARPRRPAASSAASSAGEEAGATRDREANKRAGARRSADSSAEVADRTATTVERNLSVCIAPGVPSLCLTRRRTDLPKVNPCHRSCSFHRPTFPTRSAHEPPVPRHAYSVLPPPAESRRGLAGRPRSVAVLDRARAGRKTLPALVRALGQPANRTGESDDRTRAGVHDFGLMLEALLEFGLNLGTALP